MAWRYIAQRATTKEFLDWDLDLNVETLAWALSGSGALRATITPDVGRLRAADGDLVLEEWGTYLYAEVDGLIRWGGIVIRSEFEGDAWHIEAAGFATYPNGMPFLGEIVGMDVDAAQVVRGIWKHLQSFPDGDLGVVITGADVIGGGLGKDAVAEVVPPMLQAARDIKARVDSGAAIFEDWTWDGCPAEVAAYNDALLAEWGGPMDAPTWLAHYAETHPDSTEKAPAALDIRDRLLSGQPIFEDWSWDGCPARVARYNDALMADWQKAQSPASWLQTYDDEHASDVVPAEPEQPYQLVWWEATDSGREIDDLAKAAPFDYIERHSWDGNAVRHEIELIYPRAGRRRDDLTFGQGVNVSNVVSVTSNGDDFANEVNGVGSGEGRATLRRTIAERDGRLRRVSVYSDKSVSDSSRMDAFIRDELAMRRAALRIESVDVVDHPNAPIGSWELGDDVLIDAVVPWLGRVQVWCRITGWSLTGEHTASLELERSDSFTYGG